MTPPVDDPHRPDVTVRAFAGGSSFGFDAKELVGSRYRTLFPPNESQSVEERMAILRLSEGRGRPEDVRATRRFAERVGVRVVVVPDGGG